MKNLAKSFLSAKQAVVLALCLGAFGLANAQEYRVGYINPDRIMSESAPAKAAEKKLENDFSKRNQELRDTQARLKSMGEKLDKDMAVLSESQRINKEINRIAKEGKYDLIIQDAVYISPRVDITDQVLKALNQ